MIKYRQFEMNDLNQVLKVLEPLWGHLSLKKREEYFIWKYIENPNSKNPIAYVAINDNDEIIGFRGYFALSYKLKDSSILVLSHSDATVSEKFRGKKIFSQLTIYALKELSSKKILFNTLSNDTWTTSNLYTKMGSMPLGEKAIIYCLNALFFFSKSNFFKKIEITNEFKENEFINLYSQTLDSSKIHVLENKEIWKWRYSNPASNYKFVYFWENKKLTGFLCYVKINNFRSLILNYLFLNNASIKYCLNEMLKKDKILISQMWSISKSNKEKKQLKKIGFFSLNFFYIIFNKKSIPPVLIRPGVEEFSIQDMEIDKVNITLEKNWDLNLICSDGV
jgi:hypothetical protein